MRLVLISDTHSLHDRMRSVPDGDVLIHAGDLTASGSIRQAAQGLHWLAGLPHPHKLLVAGNHDWAFERDPGVAESLVPPGVTYLRDDGVTIDGMRFWGLPWQPEFRGWAFNLPRGEQLARVWSRVPDDVQVLVTHTPPMGVLDRVLGGAEVGCADLRARLVGLHELRLHVFGHVHESYGAEKIDGRHFVNASIATVRYEPSNHPVVIDL